ncbi:hypothetical protein VULLAG_LOCUS1208 [Vulpes lagopus]
MGFERPAAWIQIWRLRLRALASAGAGLESSRFLPRIFQGPLTPSASTGSWAVGWNIQLPIFGLLQAVSQDKDKDLSWE